MTDPVQEAIAAAQKAAASTPAPSAPSVTSLPATTTPQGGAVAPVTPGQAFSMETIGAGQMSVDQWLKVKEFGLMVGEDKSLIATIKVKIDMTDKVGFAVKQGIKGGNPASYAYTFDGAIANDGKPWDQAIQRIRSLPGAAAATPYPCVDLPFIVLEDVYAPAKAGAPEGTKGALLIEAGKRLGYTTSTTNWGEWKLFYDAVKAEGLLGKWVEVELGFKPRTNKAGNAWGVVTFKSLGEHADGE